MRLVRFKDVIGNISTVNLLTKSLQNDSFPNFTIFSGEPGVGKSTCAEVSALRLTCTESVDREPCLKCDNCRLGVSVINGSGKSPVFKKINLGHRNDKDDINEIIKEVFRIDTGSDKVVFIFEEAHVLTYIQQTALLEEIDRIPENVYVIICTTKLNKLLPELRSRALRFKFNILTPKESTLLIDNITRGTNITRKGKTLITKHSKGVPRVICNTAKFVCDNSCTEDEIRDYLGELDTSLIRLVLKSYNDFSEYFRLVEELISSGDRDNLVYNIKSYLMELCILSKDVSYKETNLGMEDKRFANLVGFGTLLRIFNDFESLKDSDDTSIMFTFIKARKYMEVSNLAKKIKEEDEEYATKSQAQVVVESQVLRQENIKESTQFSDMSAEEFKSILGES